MRSAEQAVERVYRERLRELKVGLQNDLLADNVGIECRGDVGREVGLGHHTVARFNLGDVRNFYGGLFEDFVLAYNLICAVQRVNAEECRVVGSAVRRIKGVLHAVCRKGVV